MTNCILEAINSNMQMCGQARASTSTTIRACPRHTYVRECKAQVGIRGIACRLLKGSERKLAPMTVRSPNRIEIKLDRLIDDMRLFGEVEGRPRWLK
jgi:hypothetical protein